MMRLNLIPREVLQARERARHRSYWLVVSLLGAIGVAVPLVVEGLRYRRIRALEARHLDLESQVMKAQAEFDVATAESAQVVKQLEHADALRAKRAWSGLLRTIGNRLPSSCWLTLMTTDPAVPSGGSAAPPPKPSPVDSRTAASAPPEVWMDAPRRLRLAGYAPDSAQPHQFVMNLKESYLFTDVRLTKTVQEPIRDGLYYRFELECEW